MYPILHKYLLQYKKVSVPGIGNFVIETESAKFSEETSLLSAPQQVIHFKAETALADRVFFDYLAKELHIEEIEAIKNFHEFTYQLKSDISHGESIIFPGIGMLKKQQDGSFAFEQEDCISSYFPSVELKEHEVQTKQELTVDEEKLQQENFSDIELTPVDELEGEPTDYWWVYAIVLAIIGIAAIVYKYM
jgi:nucleoid DNA-binding protein